MAKSASTSLIVVALLWIIFFSGTTSRAKSAEPFTSNAQSPRKGSITLILQDESGAPWVNATVKYTQTTHDFLFGVGMTSPQGRIPPRVYEDLRTIGVNYALPFVSWTNVEPLQGKYDWHSLDYLYRPAEMHRMGYTLNGHCMIFFLDEWWNLPQYVRSMDFQQLKEAIQKHVQTLVTHYKGIIVYWTINEPTFSYSDFFKLSQAQWIKIVSTAVQSVRRSDPEAKIMINVVPADHPEIGYSPHGILDALISQGVEFDVIGIELYPRPEFGIVPDVNGYPSIEWASAMLDSFARFGKPIILSEVAVTNVPSPEAQANWLRAFYTMAFEKPFVVGITWYFVDDDPYLPGAGLFPDVDSPPRPVYQALADVIRERTSQGTTKTDSEGRVKIEGYAGDYLIEIGIGAQTTFFSLHISEGKENLIIRTLSLFSDYSTSHWAYNYVRTLVERLIISGYPDGTFKPSSTITRAEFAKLIVAAMGWDLIDPDTPSFNDVSKNFWAYKYIETAKANGAITGFPDQTFRPNNSITRAEMAVVTIRARGYQLVTLGTGFNDLPTNHWARNYILTAKDKGIISGYQDGTFKPESPATRAEAAKMIFRILN